MSKLNTEEQWIHVFAFRYALGRSSTAPGIVCDWLSDNLQKYTLFNLQLFDKEIEDYLQDPYGDVDCWIELQYKIKEELKGRAR